MDRLALIGVSHRRGGAVALEAWQEAFSEEGGARLEEAGLQEFVPIVTCNRWDLVTVVPQGCDLAAVRASLTPAGQRQRPYAFLADGALEQLSRIAASLDSLNPGEDQIMKQVRDAYAAARARGSTGPTTAFAFDTALRIAKRVRREVPLAPVHTSLFSLARPQLEACLRQGERVAVLGAGEMGALAAKGVKALGAELLVVNRSEDRARQLARHLGGQHLSLERFLAAPPAVAALICATPVRHLVSAEVLRRLGGLRLAVDLGLPRNVDAEAAAAAGVRVLDVDSLQLAGAQRRAALAERLAAAERIVREELDAAWSEWAERQLAPSIRRLRQWYLETIGDLLPPEEAERLAHRFAHVPVKGLRAVAREHGLEAARTFLAETGLAE